MEKKLKLWNGRGHGKYEQMSTGHPIVQGEVENLTQKQIYKLFIKMNTSGTPVDPKHLEKIKELYNAEK